MTTSQQQENNSLKNRYDFVVLFDVTNGNPNGDPDAGNMPRIDPETSNGLVSDVCMKRKIRNYVELAKGEDKGFRIYVQESSILTDRHREAYEAIRISDDGTKSKEKKSDKEQKKEEMQKARAWMCKNFFDVRTFGAVMVGDVDCGTLRGPVQLCFGESVEPISYTEVSITRMAATNEDEKKKKNQTFGNKHIVPYGLYRAHGFISAKLSEKTGFSEDDLNLLLEAVENMFEHDRSAARGEMAVRKLVVFKHDCALGNAPAHKLFERVKVGRNIDGEFRILGDKAYDNRPPARCFSDYSVKIDESNLPEGVTVIERV